MQIVSNFCYTKKGGRIVDLTSVGSFLALAVIIFLVFKIIGKGG